MTTKWFCISLGVHQGVVNLIATVSISIHVGVALFNRDVEKQLYTSSQGYRGERSVFPMLGLVKSGHTLNPVVEAKVYQDVDMSKMLYKYWTRVYVSGGSKIAWVRL